MSRFFDNNDRGSSPPQFPATGFPRVSGIQPLPPSAANPVQGVPGSQPGSIWVGPKTTLKYNQVAAEGPAAPDFLLASWGTPIFDLRAELKGSMSERPQAQPIRPFQSARCYMQMDGWGRETADSGLLVFASEWGSVQASEDVTQITAWEDITTDAYGGRNLDPSGATSTSYNLTVPTRSVLVWEPPPSRMRYWQIKVRFVWQNVATTPPRVTVCGAMY